MTAAPDSPDTFFASAGRKDEAELREEIELCVNNPIALAVLGALDGYVAVLNAERQILAVNDTLREALRREGVARPEGLRWGEANHCVHVPEGPGGCGTSRACRYCGAAMSFLAAQEDHAQVTGECRMAIERDGRWEAREFQLKVTPVALPWGEILVPVFHDVSDTHRREVLEEAFLHDLSGTLSALSCWSDLMNLGAVEAKAAAGRITAIAAQLAEVVAHQRLILRAEKGDLAMESRVVASDAVLGPLLEALRSHPAALAKAVTVSLRPGASALLETDPTLLHRILCNMGINALEAALQGETVTLGFTQDGGPRFHVHNPGCMPEDVAMRVFQRAFSTKARAGRGLGTYAMKLLGENFLGGKVGFTSTPADGTEFWIRL